jgi:hypothetical protein
MIFVKKVNNLRNILADRGPACNTWGLSCKYYLLGSSVWPGFDDGDVDAKEADAADNWRRLTMSNHVPHERVPILKLIATHLAHIPP